MKIITSILLFWIVTTLCHAQITINSDSYHDGTLVVETNSRTAPNSTSGVIIPRVEDLNKTDPKEDGLLVYLDNPTPPLASGEFNGFYYWDNSLNKWTPLQSRYGANITDNSQFFASGSSFATAGGYMDDINSPIMCTIALDVLTTNNPALCSLANNTVTVNKTGWYYFQISVTLTKTSSPAYFRDILCLQMLLNGTHAYSITSPGNDAIVRSFNSFAALSPISDTFTTYAPLKLNSGDKIQLSVERIYKDPEPTNESPSVPLNRTNVTYTVTPGTTATLVGKYLGNF